MFGLQRHAEFFAFLSNEISLEDRCFRNWNRYFEALADTVYGSLILEQANLNVHRESWRRKESKITGVHRSKRYIEYC
jgi:hypothetical protein